MIGLPVSNLSVNEGSAGVTAPTNRPAERPARPERSAGDVSLGMVNALALSDGQTNHSGGLDTPYHGGRRTIAVSDGLARRARLQSRG